jgi:hypothetical protein
MPVVVRALRVHGMILLYIILYDKKYTRYYDNNIVLYIIHVLYMVTEVKEKRPSSAGREFEIYHCVNNIIIAIYNATRRNTMILIRSCCNLYAYTMHTSV